jgi:RNA polymerase sigma-70 factor, ECF subfamily
MPTDHLETALAGATRGDEADLTTLYRALNPGLLRYLRHHVGSAADDVASEVWMALAPQLADYAGTVDGLRALMYTVARRRTIDHYRRTGRRAPTVSFDETFDRRTRPTSKPTRSSA